MAGAKGAKAAPAPPPYEYQEYPKVLYGEDGSVHRIENAEHEARHLKKAKVAYSDTPADFLEDGDPDKPEAPAAEGKKGKKTAKDSE